MHINIHTNIHTYKTPYTYIMLCEEKKRKKKKKHKRDESHVFYDIYLFYL